jgi:hypothetical protein
VEAPQLNCHADLNVSTDLDLCTYSYNPTLTSGTNPGQTIDNCTPFNNLTITYLVYNPDNSISGPYTNGTNYLFVPGVSQVEYKVVDAAGNYTTCTQEIKVTDNQYPVITCPTIAASYNNTPGICGYIASNNQFNATATDNCQVVSLTHNYSPWGNPNNLNGATFPVGQTVVRWTAVDAKGNISFCYIIINVNDVEAPVFVNCPEGQTFTIGADANCINGEIWSIPVATDNCGVLFNNLENEKNVSGFSFWRTNC